MWHTCGVSMRWKIQQGPRAEKRKAKKMREMERGKRSLHGGGDGLVGAGGGDKKYKDSFLLNEMSKNKNSNNNLPDRITVRANRSVGILNKTKMAERRKRGIKNTWNRTYNIWNRIREDGWRAVSRLEKEKIPVWYMDGPECFAWALF